MNLELRTPKPLTVLVVDDNPDDLKLISIYLRRTRPFGHESIIETAADGCVALEKIGERLYSLILLDWNLPRNSHGHVLREMRHRAIYIPVVVISGLVRSEISTDLSALGAAYLDKKDLNADSLDIAIEEALRLSQALLKSPPPSDGGPESPGSNNSRKEAR